MKEFKINRQKAELTISATSKKQYPKKLDLEVVLVGKSNVGKSSFVNSMLRKKEACKNK